MTDHYEIMNQIPLGLSFDDVLLIPQYSEISSRSEVNLTTKLTSGVSLGIPLISSNMMDITGTEMSTTLGKLGGLGVFPRFVSPENEAEWIMLVKQSGLCASASVGCKEGEMERADLLVKAKVDLLFLDVAHGHLRLALDMTSKLKNHFGKEVEIVSGNVSTFEGTRDLFRAGADSVKVGIGPGSICTTRVVTGSGVPQITAILECAKAARHYNKSIISDGGTKNSGDIVKALASGASAVMIGNMFAGSDEAPSELVEIDDKKYKRYNASTSLAEKENHIKINGDLPKNYIKQIEGIESLVPYKGPLGAIIEKLLAGIKSGFSYSGANNLEQLWKKAKFIQVTNLGIRENGFHDVLPQ